MKQGWEIKKLGEVCKITMGQSPSSNTYNDSEGLPFYQGNADFGKVNPIARVYCNAPIRIAENNDILISVRAPIGAINIANCKCCIGRGLASIRSTKTLSNEFVYHALIANKEKLIAQGTGSTFKSIGRNTLEELPIPVPPLPVQEQIVSELDLLSGIIEKKREQLKELDALAQSIFYDMFGDPITNEKGWEVKKLGEVCDVRDGTHDSPNYLEYSDYVLITSKNITCDGNIDFSFANYISKEDYDFINKRSYVESGDIIMAMIGTIGKPIIVKETNKKFCIKNVALIKFGCSTMVINTYIQAMLNNPNYGQYILSQNKGGTQKFIALGTIRNLLTPLPSMEIQHLFASKIEAIERQKELIKQSISETETLFNERMQHYFS